MWASVTDRGPTLTQLLFKAFCRYYSQHEVGLLTNVEWILAINGDAGPTFTRHWVGVGLHCLTRSPANTRRSSSQQQVLTQRGLRSSEPCGKDAVDIKNGFHHIKMHSLYLSTLQMSYLVTLISKAFDTTSNSYQPLWLRCWKGDIPSFSYKKTRLF